MNTTPETPDGGARAGELVPKIYDAEVIDTEVITDNNEHNNDGGGSTARRAGLVVRRKVIDCTGYVVRRVRESDRAARWRALLAYRVRKAPQDLLRLLWFLLRGHGRWIAKGWTWATYADLRGDVRQARMAGDAQARREAQETLRADAKARWAKLAIGLRRVVVTAAVVVVVLVLLALTEMLFDRASMPDWLAALYEIRDGIGAGIVAVVPWLLTVGPIGWIAAATWEGRDKTPGAGWLVQPDRGDAESWVDERMISRALAHLGVAPLNRFSRTVGN